MHQSSPKTLPQLLRPFRYRNEPRKDAHAAALKARRRDLPPLPRLRPGTSGEAALASLARREQAICGTLRDYYRLQADALAGDSCRVNHAYELLSAHTRLLDGVLSFAFAATLDELPYLVRVQVAEGRKELAFKEKLLPSKQEKLAALQTQIEVVAADGGSEPGELDYLRRIETTLVDEVAECRTSLARLQADLPILEHFQLPRRAVLQRLVMFARGGYGRAEVSFNSDLDLGYCLDPRGLAPGETTVLRALILRVEALLHNAGIATVHQYFEVDEDLSRFVQPDTIHTIPSVLESRPIAGNAALFAELRQRFMVLLPFEGFVQRKLADFEAQAVPPLAQMDLKEHRGGLRTIQIPLWIFGASRKAASFMTGDLVALARQHDALTEGEAFLLLRALESWHDLRNFLGAEERMAGRPAFTEHLAEDKVDVFDAAAAARYVERRGRFSDVERLTGYHLRLAEGVGRIAERMLGRVLNRTVSHKVEHLRISVHLGSKRITRVSLWGGKGKGAAQWQARDVSVLFAYMARTGYDLTAELREALGSGVRRLALPRSEEGQGRLARRFSQVLAGPFAHRAVAGMLAIDDPLAAGMDTLLGRLIPELEASIYLLRPVGGADIPLHLLLIRSLAEGQRGWDALRRRFPEWRQVLGDEQLLALKWSLLLHSLGRLHQREDDPALGAERAVQVLRRLGYRDPGLEGLVRLLIRHHDTLIRLSRMATYIDLALEEYFELGGRKLVDMVLLYLANLAVLRAAGTDGGQEESALKRFFHEARRILVEQGDQVAADAPLEPIINRHLDQRKEDLKQTARLFVLLNRSLTVGLEQAILEPLGAINPDERERLQARMPELQGLYRQMLAVRDQAELERMEDRAAQRLGRHLSQRTLEAMTSDEEGAFSWFFAAFPNRYVLSMTPQHLAGEVVKFSRFRQADVVVDFVPGAQAGIQGMLVFTRQLQGSHTRVAYALSRRRINILTGKVNRVELGHGQRGYCYFFQFSLLSPDIHLVPSDLEHLILGPMPPHLPGPPTAEAYSGPRVDIQFVGDDGKGYRIEPEGAGFVRRSSGNPHIRIDMQDQPYLFFRVSRAFDLFGAEIQQSLITTTGNQVVDYFYLRPEDFERLRDTGFGEALGGLIAAEEPTAGA